MLPLMRFYSTREEAAADAAKTDFKSQPLEAFDFVCISLKPYRIQFFRCVEKLFVVGPRLGMSLSDSRLVTAAFSLKNTSAWWLSSAI